MTEQESIQNELDEMNETAETVEQPTVIEPAEPVEMTEDELFSSLDELLTVEEKTITLDFDGKTFPLTIKPLTTEDNIKILQCLTNLTPAEYEILSAKDPNFARKRIDRMSPEENHKATLNGRILTCILGTVSPKWTKTRLKKYAKSRRGVRFIQELSTAIEELGGADITRLFFDG